MSEVQLITAKLMDEVRRKAELSARRRMNYNFHGSAEENPHRFLNVMMRGSYVRPHRHADPAKAESWVVLEGAVKLFTFDDSGRVSGAWVLTHGGEQVGIDLSAGVWHTVVVLSDRATVFEVKPGPYDAATDKEFAAWAPAEGAPEAAGYLERLLSRAAREIA
jgi:cupin fold WbuC family metalloprotein